MKSTVHTILQQQKTSLIFIQTAGNSQEIFHWASQHFRAGKILVNHIFQSTNLTDEETSPLSQKATLLNVYYMPDTVLSAWDVRVNSMSPAVSTGDKQSGS